MRPTARKRLATRMGAGCRHFGLVWVYASACAATLHSPQRRHCRAGGNPQRQANQAKPAQPAQPAQPAFMRPTARKRLATRMEAGCRRFGLFGFGMRLGLRRYASQPPTPSLPRRRESTAAFKPRLRLPSARQWRAINGCLSAEARAASSRFGRLAG